MKVTVITVPGDLKLPPAEFPHDPLRCIAEIIAEGGQVKFLDNYAWRAAMDVVGDDIRRNTPELILMWGPLESLRNIRRYADAAKDACPVLIVGDHWKYVPWVELPFPRLLGAPESILGNVLTRGDYKFKQKTGRAYGVNRLPYAPYNWLSLDPYPPGIPYGPQAEQWKLRLDVEADRLGKPFSAKYLVELVKYLRIRHGMDGVRFIGNLVDEPKRAVEFCSLMRTSDLCLALSWICDIDYHAIEYGRMQRMKDNNCVGVRLPIKNVDVFTSDYERKALEAAVNVGKVLDIPVFVEFKVGYPSDSIEAYRAAVEFTRITEIECRPIIATPQDLLENLKLSPQRKKQLWNHIGRVPSLNMSPWRTPTFLGLRELMAREDLDELNMVSSKRRG